MVYSHVHSTGAGVCAREGVDQEMVLRTMRIRDLLAGDGAVRAARGHSVRGSAVVLC